jgi:CheY-like chemotaxis protein
MVSPGIGIEERMTARILLVDDEHSILTTLTAILQGNGFQVVSAASALEAKEKLAHSKFDLIITDLRMESESAGFEVLKKALEQPYKPATLLLTAYPMPSEEWSAHGADGLLEKPADMGQLLRTIGQLLAPE